MQSVLVADLYVLPPAFVTGLLGLARKHEALLVVYAQRRLRPEFRVIPEEDGAWNIQSSEAPWKTLHVAPNAQIAAHRFLDSGWKLIGSPPNDDEQEWVQILQEKLGSERVKTFESALDLQAYLSARTTVHVTATGTSDGLLLTTENHDFFCGINRTTGTANVLLMEKQEFELLEIFPVTPPSRAPAASNPFVLGFGALK